MMIHFVNLDRLRLRLSKKRRLQRQLLRAVELPQILVDLQFLRQVAVELLILPLQEVL